jgi:hypothetical protein
MRKIKIAITLFSLSLFVSGCTLFGLDAQEDYEFKPNTLDNKIDMTAGEFLLSNPTNEFNYMLAALDYTGISIDEFNKTGRTYFLLHDLAVYRLATNGTVDANCYFGKNKVNGQPGTKWEDYPVEQIRDLILYHIVEGEYSFENLTPDNVEVHTLKTGSNNLMMLKVINDRDSKLTINDFFNSLKLVRARTAGIVATNGPVHILGDYAEYGVK